MIDFIRVSFVGETMTGAPQKLIYLQKIVYAFCVNLDVIVYCFYYFFCFLVMINFKHTIEANGK